MRRNRRYWWIIRFPGFDRGTFERLTPDDIRRMNDEICAAASASPVSYASGDPFTAAWDRPDYAQPDWWSAPGTRATATDGPTPPAVTMPGGSGFSPRSSGHAGSSNPHGAFLSRVTGRPRPGGEVARQRETSGR